MWAACHKVLQNDCKTSTIPLYILSLGIVCHSSSSNNKFINFLQGSLFLILELNCFKCEQRLFPCYHGRWTMLSLNFHSRIISFRMWSAQLRLPISWFLLCSSPAADRSRRKENYLESDLDMFEFMIKFNQLSPFSSPLYISNNTVLVKSILSKRRI